MSSLRWRLLDRSIIWSGPTTCQSNFNHNNLKWKLFGQVLVLLLGFISDRQMCSFSIWGRANKNPLQTKCLTFISATTQLSSHALRSPPAASCCPRPSPPCCQDCWPACQASCLLPPPPILQPPAFSMPGKGTPCPDYLATFICNHLDYSSMNLIIRL